MTMVACNHAICFRKGIVRFVMNDIWMLLMNHNRRGPCMSKYALLEQFLLSSGRDEITMTFPEIQGILGFDLPKSAYLYNTWWANCGHSQARTWLDAGYKVDRINLKNKTVCFYQSVSKQKRQSHHQKRSPRTVNASTPIMLVLSTTQTINVCGYEFCYLQQLIPECDTNGCVTKHYPQGEYDNRKNLPLSYYGKGAFCRFSINAGEWPGVYLWVVDNSIIYIGETVGLKSRFNMGYGRIAPRNCYVGGQSTNCKMNKVVLDLFERGKIVSLFFYYTTDFKQIELELLGKIKTTYNVKR
jgi:hypothetical protein